MTTSVGFAEEKFGSDASRTTAFREEKKLIGRLYRLSDNVENARCCQSQQDHQLSRTKNFWSS